MNRRGLILGLAGALAVPALARAGSLMPGTPTARLVRFAAWRPEDVLVTHPDLGPFRLLVLRPADARDIGRSVYQLRPGFWKDAHDPKAIPYSAVIGRGPHESLGGVVWYPDGSPVFPDWHAATLNGERP